MSEINLFSDEYQLTTTIVCLIVTQTERHTPIFHIEGAVTNFQI